MIFGSDGLFRIPFDRFETASDICSVALIFIMFYGGFGTNWKRARKTAAPAILLATAGVVITAALTGLFCRFVLSFPWLESFLLGSVVSSTDAASVFSILRSRRLNLRHNTASLLEMESGSNDPASYMLTVVFLSLLHGEATGWSIVRMLLLQIVVGTLLGFLVAVLAVRLLQRVRIRESGMGAVFVTGVALLAYALASVLGGNGYLSVYLVGIVLGNSSIPGKKQLVHFFDGVTGITQMLIFFLLGLLCFPSRMTAIAGTAAAIAAYLLFFARPCAVIALMSPFGMKLPQRLTITWAGFRGASSIVFAIMAITSVQTEHDLFHIVFFIVLISILLQGSLLPVVARKLNMIDEKEDVLKTFNDYTEETPVQFIRIEIPEDHPWAGLPLREIALPPRSLAVMILRRGKRIVPNGDTILHGSDTLVLAGDSADDLAGLSLSEVKVTADSAFAGVQLSELPKSSALVILINRGGRTIIPDGSTTILAGDTLVIHHT